MCLSPGLCSNYSFAMFLIILAKTCMHQFFTAVSLNQASFAIFPPYTWRICSGQTFRTLPKLNAPTNACPPPTPGVYVYVARCAPRSSIVTIAGAAGMPLWRSAAQRRQRRGSHARIVCSVHRSEAAVRPGLHWALTGNNNSITHLSCDITVTAHHRSPSVNIRPVPSRPVPVTPPGLLTRPDHVSGAPST